MLGVNAMNNNSAVLVYPPSLHFTVAFLACCQVGIVAVPVFPPHPHRRDSLHMFAGIVATCEATFALTDKSYNYQKKMLSIKDALLTKLHKRSVAAWPDALTWIVTDDAVDDNSTMATKSKPTGMSTGNDLQTSATTTLKTDVDKRSRLAFLQFTSGSTSDPKGVMITHGNLAHNLSCIVTELQADKDTIVVSWLPQYHDMGLIGSVLGCLYCGGTGYYLSPLTFLQQPAIWMESVARYKATHLQTPNFALKLTARKWSVKVHAASSSATAVALDFSSVRHIINAAEPVDVESMTSFYDVFEPLGLQRGVIYPTYGLAEHTVFVCSGGKQVLHVRKHELEVEGKVVECSDADDSTGPDEAPLSSTIVGCGFPANQGIDVRIVNAETCAPEQPDVVGEIWIHSPSKAAGYYKKPNESRDDFHAVIVDGSGNSDGYLRTGDLGFLHNDELFICGRIKDLIIVGGRNYYPQDIEATAEVSSDRIRLGCSAAFTVDPTHEGGEEVAIVMELKEVPAAKDVEKVCLALANHIKSAINQEHSLGVASIAFLKTRTVPKTSSGKIARSWCRKEYIAGTLQEVYRKSYKSEMTSTAAEQENGSTNLPTSPKSNSTKAVDVAAIRSLSNSDILRRLVSDLSQLSNVPVESIDKKAALIHMLDSITIAQFKGILENNYGVKISDEYLFRESTTATKLVEVVKLGYAPDDAEGENAAAMATGSGKVGGLAGALGCPPGVFCVII